MDANKKIWHIFQKVLQFMVEERLPKEIKSKKLELQIFEDVINERNINVQYMSDLQNQVRCINYHLLFNIDFENVYCGGQKQQSRYL